MILKDKLKQVPKLPGVYFFRDKKSKIIYIGKAKILRNRVRSYFNKKQNQDHKTLVMVKNIHDLEWIVVRSEVEALLAEANLIKEHKPRYNVFLKDDKTFPYIRVTNEPYPRVEIIRQKNLTKDNHNYFGPYTDAGYLREVLRVLHKIFPIRTCTYYIDDKSISSQKIKICLDYHIKRCDGPCEGLVSQADYSDMIKQVILFLKGRNKGVQDYLSKQMYESSSAENFEDAARYRDQLNAVLSFTQKQKKIGQDFMDRDIIVVSAENNYGIGLVMRIRNGHIIGREKLYIQVYNNDDYKTILSQFILQYYSSTVDIPEEILVEYNFDQIDEYIGWLKSVRKKKVSIIIPKKGEKLNLVEMSKRNAELLLGEIRLKKAKRKELVVKPILHLQDDLGMEISPIRIEAFDNSNIHGSNPVAGMVTFINGKPKKSEYRKFHIKTVKGIDDFASMHEVVSRRYSRQIKENKSLPDLILIDGGKGQLSAAKSALDSLGLGYITIIGLAKRLEEVYKPGVSDPQNISKTSPGLYLLRKIRDEVHRYAITFHRKIRDKSMMKSIFDDISGMGPKRVKKLWDSFKTLKDIQNSTKEEIHLKTGFPIKISEQILIVSKKNFN